jgi:hypothetical protein
MWLALVLAWSGELAPARAEADAPYAYVFAATLSEDLDQAAVRAEGAARAVLPGAATNRLLGYAPSELQSLARARSAFELGKQAYLDLELDRAIELLNAAVVDFDRSIGVMEPPAREELGSALLFLGACQVFADQQRAAKATFERLHVQMPAQAPDPDTFNPDIVARYDQAAPRDRESPTASLTVTTDKPGAEVYVDFVPAGHTPVTIGGLIAGTHIVRVMRPGSAPHVEQVAVNRARPTELEVTLVERPELSGLGDFVDSYRRAELAGGPVDVREISRLTGASVIGALVLGGRQGEQVTLGLRYHGPEGLRFSRERTVPLARGDFERGVQAFVLEGLGYEAPLVPAGCEDDSDCPAGHSCVDGGCREVLAPPPPGEPTILERWWFWAAVGGAAILGASAAILLSDEGSPPVGVALVEF